MFDIYFIISVFVCLDKYTRTTIRWVLYKLGLQRAVVDITLSNNSQNIKVLYVSSQ